MDILVLMLEHPFGSLLIVLIIMVLLGGLLQSLLDGMVDRTTYKINNKYNTKIKDNEARGLVNRILISIIKSLK